MVHTRRGGDIRASDPIRLSEPSTHPFIHSSIHPPIHPSTHLTIHSSIHPSTHLIIHPSIHPLICPFAHVLIKLCLCVRTSPALLALAGLVHAGEREDFLHPREAKLCGDWPTQLELQGRGCRAGELVAGQSLQECGNLARESFPQPAGSQPKIQCGWLCRGRKSQEEVEPLASPPHLTLLPSQPVELGFPKEPSPAWSGGARWGRQQPWIPRSSSCLSWLPRAKGSHPHSTPRGKARCLGLDKGTPSVPGGDPGPLRRGTR